MKSFITAFLLLICAPSFAQLCHTQITQGAFFHPTNEIHSYKKYDFSDLWLTTANQHVYGIIGSEHQRIHVKLISVVKNQEKPLEYIVYGKSMVKGNVCEFGGIIKIRAILLREEIGYGIDSTYKHADIISAGLIQADYTFYENRHQPHTGTFEGMLQSKWYMDSKNQIYYDDIRKGSDGYFNNSFVGTWQQYGAEKGKLAHWGDYRVPNCNCDFDIGVGEISISAAYHKFGWLDVVLGNNMTKGIKKSKKSKKQLAWWK